jgi:hypothetical protein
MPQPNDEPKTEELTPIELHFLTKFRQAIRLGWSSITITIKNHKVTEDGITMKTDPKFLRKIQ